MKNRILRDGTFLSVEPKSHLFKRRAEIAPSYAPSSNRTFLRAELKSHLFTIIFLNLIQEILHNIYITHGVNILHKIFNRVCRFEGLIPDDFMLSININKIFFIH